MEEIINKHMLLVCEFNVLAARLGVPPYTGSRDAAGDDIVITEEGKCGEQLEEDREKSFAHQIPFDFGMNGYRFLHTKPVSPQPQTTVKTNTERAFSVLKETLPRERHEKTPYKATQTIPNFNSTQRDSEARRSRETASRARAASANHNRDVETLTKSVSLLPQTNFLRYPWTLTYSMLPPPERFAASSRTIGDNASPEATARQLTLRDVYFPKTSDLVKMQNYINYKAPAFETSMDKFYIKK